MVVHRLLLLLEQILEDELAPSAVACVHQRATLVELSQLDGCEPEFFGQIRHGSDRVLVVAREDTRRTSNGGLTQSLLGQALKRPTSRYPCGYWQGNKPPIMVWKEPRTARG